MKERETRWRRPPRTQDPRRSWSREGATSRCKSTRDWSLTHRSHRHGRRLGGGQMQAVPQQQSRRRPPTARTVLTQLCHSQRHLPSLCLLINCGLLHNLNERRSWWLRALTVFVSDTTLGMGRGLDDVVGDRRQEAGGGGVVECHNSPIPAEVDPGAKQPLAVRRPHPRSHAEVHLEMHFS